MWNTICTNPSGSVFTSRQFLHIFIAHNAVNTRENPGKKLIQLKSVKLYIHTMFSAEIPKTPRKTPRTATQLQSPTAPKKRKITGPSLQVRDENKHIAAENAQAAYARRAQKKAPAARFSETNKFIIIPDVYPQNKYAAYSVWIREDAVTQSLADCPELLQPTSDTLSKKGNTYYRVTAAFTIADPQCLQLGEGVAIDDPYYTDTASQLAVACSGKLFGVKDQLNIARSQECLAIAADESNNFANPGPRESFAIVRQDVEDGWEPFHIGPVLFQDGASRITIEADASSPDEHFPTFNMYTVDVANVAANSYNTFHERYGEYFTADSNAAPITIVLTRR